MALEKECPQSRGKLFCLGDAERVENKSLSLKGKRLVSLKRKKDFLRLKKKGVFFFSHWIGASFLPSSEGGLRLALSFSRKSLPRAVDRNRLKRLAREHLRNETLSGDLRVYLKKKKKGFYSSLRRKEFENQFKKFIQKIKNFY